MNNDLTIEELEFLSIEAAIAYLNTGSISEKEWYDQLMLERERRAHLSVSMNCECCPRRVDGTVNDLLIMGV